MLSILVCSICLKFCFSYNVSKLHKKPSTVAYFYNLFRLLFIQIFLSSSIWIYLLFGNTFMRMIFFSCAYGATKPTWWVIMQRGIPLIILHRLRTFLISKDIKRASWIKSYSDFVECMEFSYWCSFIGKGLQLTGISCLV